MRIVIDTSPLRSGHKHRGIGMYTRHLAEAMMKHFPQHKYFLTSKSTNLEADIIHFPYFDFFSPTLPLFKNKPSVVTIHDTIP